MPLFFFHRNPAIHLALCAAMGVAACQGCNTKGQPPMPNGTSSSPLPDPGPPTLRLYLVSNLAGALEPCGCTKDQLGGMDHFGAWVAAERPRAPASAVAAAGPLFFMDPELKADRAEQDKQKSETIARAMNGMGFVAFAPSANDWAGGKDLLLANQKTSGAALLLANAAGYAGHTIKELGGVKVGFFGVGQPPKGEETKPVEGLVKPAVESLKKEGAQVIIALASVGRGEAKRIADAAPEDLIAVVVGAPTMGGETNTPAPAAERVGQVIVAESANHLQSVAVLDLFVRDGSFKFADATGLERARKREELTRRIDELRVRIANWEKDGKVAQKDLDDRREELKRLQAERDGMDVLPPPAKGSFFRYAVKEIKNSLGSDPKVQEQMLAFYKKVNEANKELFKDRKPRPHDGTQPVYVGTDACTGCHEPQRKFWDKTSHAKAYATLEKQFKEFNLECVSCHVTGYDQPGGSTVTHVDKLKNVGCEVCHGPGSKHGLDPKNKSLIIANPRPDTCLSCHHPPHVEQFEATAKMREIIGPGHGLPLK